MSMYKAGGYTGVQGWGVHRGTRLIQYMSSKKGLHVSKIRSAIKQQWLFLVLKPDTTRFSEVVAHEHIHC